MATPRKRGTKRTTAVVADDAPAAAVSVAEPINIRRSAPPQRVLDAMDAESDGDLPEFDDGSDLFFSGAQPAPIAQAADVIDAFDGNDGVTEDTAAGRVWAVPDTMGTLRRMPNAIETTQQPVREMPPPETFRPRAVTSIRKHKSAETMPAAPTPEIATHTGTDPNSFGKLSEPLYMRPRRAKDLDRDDDRPAPPEMRDALTERLGCRWFTNGPRFDWCREGPYNLNPPGELDSRNRHHFTRWYEMDRILVDIFARDSDAVRREIAEKIAAIKARAAVEGAPIGYLPSVSGAFIDPDVIEAVKRGEIVPFQLAQMRSGSMAV